MKQVYICSSLDLPLTYPFCILFSCRCIDTSILTEITMNIPRSAANPDQTWSAT